MSAAIALPSTFDVLAVASRPVLLRRVGDLSAHDVQIELEAGLTEAFRGRVRLLIDGTDVLQMYLSPELQAALETFPAGVRGEVRAQVIDAARDAVATED